MNPFYAVFGLFWSLWLAGMYVILYGHSERLNALLKNGDNFSAALAAVLFLGFTLAILTLIVSPRKYK